MSQQQHNGGPAFPHDDHDVYSERVGMSLRDYFAAKAMQGFLSDPKWRDDILNEFTAHHAYRMADAMLEASQLK